MHKIPAHLFRKIETVAKTVKAELRSKGYVFPVKNFDGSITLENFTIAKQPTGFYSILNSHNETVVDKINLPQTAAILANGLALGKWLDDEIYRYDQEYGYKSFEQELFNKRAVVNLKKNNIDRAELLFIKAKVAHDKVENVKRHIFDSFEKLRRIR